MTKRAPDDAPAPQRAKRNLRNSVAIALALLALAGIFYAMTIVKLSKHATLPHGV